MIELNENIPFLWRLSCHDSDGLCVVSMVVPFGDGDQSLEHTIETDVLSLANDGFEDEEEEILEWNEDDISLFMKLISNRHDLQQQGATSIRVDLTDPETIEIVHIVAAAGFGLALPADHLIKASGHDIPSAECEIGSQVSVHTLDGYKRCVVVDMEEEEVVCVLLDRIEADDTAEFETINAHDLLLVKRHHVLQPQYTSLTPVPADVLH